MRRCSICKKIGHTKRSCTFEIQKKSKRSSVPVDVVDKVDSVEETTFVLEPKKKSEKNVFVRVDRQAEQSPHVLHLRGKEQEKAWTKIPVFREEKLATKPKRVSIDLGAMVRDANEKNKEYLSKKSADLYFSSLPKLQKPLFFKKQKKQKKISTLPEEVSQRKTPLFLRIKTRCIESSANILDQSRRTLGNRRVLISFFVFLFIAALPYPAMAYYKNIKKTSVSVLEQSTNGFLALQSSTVAALHADITGATENLNHALESFATAESLVDGEHQAMQYIASFLPFIGTQIESRRHILAAGQHVALGNTYLLKGISDASGTANPYLTDRLFQLREHLRFSLPQYKEALNDLAAVNEKVVPLEYQNSFQDFKVLFAAFVNDTQNMVDFIDTMEQVFGSDDFKRYLIVFQNNHELRATGGFMGSFAILDVQKGKILGLSVPPGGSYDLQGQLDVRVKPPIPLLLSNNRWEFQDANWWPDFPASAKKMAWFYQHGRGTTVDGVIAVNATVFEDLLSAIGPLRNTEHNVTLDAKTALDSLQYKVEVDYDKASNTPKAIIGDLLAQLVSEIPQKNSAEALKILVTLHKALEKKDIQAYFVDSKIQDTVASFGWSGEIVATDKMQDYFLAVNSNLQGQKSDAKIDQVIEHQAEVQEDGSILDTVVIRRTHSGSVGEMFYGAANISYLRLYVPEGAELVEAGGLSSISEEAFRSPEKWAIEDTDLSQRESNRIFDSKTGVEMYTSFGKTVLAGWIVTNPGETSEVYFTYKLPSRLSMSEKPQTSPEKWQTAFFSDERSAASRYSLVVQKQSGQKSDFTSTLIYPTNWRPVWKSRDDIDLALNGGIFHTILEKDEMYGIVMEK